MQESSKSFSTLFCRAFQSLIRSCLLQKAGEIKSIFGIRFNAKENRSEITEASYFYPRKHFLTIMWRHQKRIGLKKTHKSLNSWLKIAWKKLEWQRLLIWLLAHITLPWPTLSAYALSEFVLNGCEKARLIPLAVLIFQQQLRCKKSHTLLKFKGWKFLGGLIFSAWTAGKVCIFKKYFLKLSRINISLSRGIF